MVDFQQWDKVSSFRAITAIYTNQPDTGMQHFHHAVTYRELTISWNAAGLTNTQTYIEKHTYTRELSRPLGHAVWVKNREWEWARAAAGAMGWVGPYGEQRGAGGGLGDGGGWGGLRGDPEPGAACLIGAHLHSSGAGDTWRAFPALSAKWLPLPIFHKSDSSSCLLTIVFLSEHQSCFWYYTFFSPDLAGYT